MKVTYAEKLKDPRWQKKRLEIMERDEWTCQWCVDSESPLNSNWRVLIQAIQNYLSKYSTIHHYCAFVTLR